MKLINSICFPKLISSLQIPVSFKSNPSYLAMSQRDEIESQIIKETQYSFKEEAIKKSSQNDPKKEEVPQKPQTSEQMTTPTTPRARVELPRTPPLAAQPDSPSQDPGAQSSHTQGDDDDSEQEEEVILQEPESDEVEPHTLPDFDWEALETEYFEAMDRANNAELELGEEFKQLANVSSPS